MGACDNEKYEDAILKVSEIAMYLDKIGRGDLADDLMNALDNLK